MNGEGVPLAVFVDYENVAIGAREAKLPRFRIERVLSRLLDKGSVLFKRAYADWTRYSDDRRDLHEHGFELVEVPHVSYGGKNSADIRLVVDAIDLCHTKSHIGTFAIVSGDSDFSPLVSKLRENGRQVIGVGVRASTSKLLVEACDDFLFYDDLASRGPRASGSGHPADPYDLVVQTVEALLSDRGEAVWGSHVKQVLKRKVPDFDERRAGVHTWGELLEEARRRGRLELTHDAPSGGYRIHRVKRT